MRIVPKQSKIKTQFYRGFTIVDVLIALIALGFIALILSSNIASKYVLAVAILAVVAPMYITFGDVRLYQVIINMLRFVVAKKQFTKSSTKKNHISALYPYESIKDNLIKTKDNKYIGVMEIDPIEFNLLTEEKQNYLISVISNTLKNVGLYQEYDLVKLDKAVLFNEYLEDELTRLKRLIAENENNNLTEQELRKRIAVVEDRINLYNLLNTSEKIYTSAYFILIQDMDKENLNNTLDVFKQILSNANIESKRLNNKELAIFLKYNYTKDFEENEFDIIREKEYIKQFYPNSVVFKLNGVKQDNKKISHFVITDYPLKVGNAWGQGLFDIPNTKVVFKCKPVEQFKAIKRIDNTINELITQNTSGKYSSQIDKQTHLESLQILLEGLQNENETFFDTSLIITVYDNEKDNTNKKLVKRKLRELGFRFSEMIGKQIDSYLSSNLNDYIKVPLKGLNSSIIAAAFPYVSCGLMDKKGLLLGENELPVLVDFFKRNEERVNSNMVVIGQSGSGKSFATKTILTGLSSDDARIFILDPENEYGKLAQNLNGTVLDVSNDSLGRINPFHIILSIDDEQENSNNSSFFAHLQFLEEFFKLILQGISTDCLEILNKTILDVYKKKGITNKTELNTLKAEDYPIFDDLIKEIEKFKKKEVDEYNLSCYKILSNYLGKFGAGGRYSNIWNGCTTFAPKENFVCFNFQKLLANKNNLIANAQMLLILKWLENEIIKNRDYNILHNAEQKIVIAIDEAHIFIDDKFYIALDFMHSLAKRIRKYNGMLIVITQNIKDFTGSPDIARKTSAIINVSQYSLIFSLSPNDVTDLCALYEKAGQINENEIENIVSLPRGSAYLVTSPHKRTNLSIVATPYIKQLFD